MHEAQRLELANAEEDGADSYIVCRDLFKIYKRADLEVVALRGIDLDVAPGELRLRARGGAGGHNGMKSIIAAIGTQDFARLRIGIGRPPAGDEIDHVLGAAPPDERAKIGDAVERAAQAAACVLDEGIDTAMNRFN